MSKPVLYYYFLSSCSWRVRIALAYKGIEVELKSVDNTKLDQYLAINPSGKVPALGVNGYFIAESIAILEYLEEKYPEEPLLPKNLLERAKVREICELIVSGIQPLQNPSVADKYSDDPAKQLEWSQFYINKGFAALEKILEATSTDGKFCLGNSLTTADCCLAPQVFNAVERFQVDIKPFPTIHGIYAALMELEYVKFGRPDLSQGI